MRYYLLLIIIGLFGCGSPELPTFQAMTKLIKDSVEPSVCLYPFPKRIFIRGDGVFNIETEKAWKTREKYEEGSRKGFWEIVEEEEGTGEYFFSTEKKNYYYRIIPKPEYSEYFNDKISDDGQNYFLILRKIIVDTVINIVPVKIDNNEVSEIMVFYKASPYNLPLYDLINPQTCFDEYGDGRSYLYINFSKVNSKWILKSKSSMTEFEYKEITK